MSSQEIQSKIKFLMPDGSFMDFDAYQKQFGLTGKQIAKHFYYNEPRFVRDLEDFDELIVCHTLMKLADAYRKRKGASVSFNSFNRTDAKQAELKAKGYKTATTSPHVAKLAFDADTTTEQETRLNAKMITEAARELGIKARVIFEPYLKEGQTFIHVDVCPEYYAPGKPWHNNPHPQVWENEIAA